MAGLLAARVLTDYFDSVTIVERDRFPKHQDRAGVRLSRIVHMCCWCRTADSGTAFPGLEAELTAAGASTCRLDRRLPMLGFSGWEPRFSSGLITRTCSRNLLEWTVRTD